MTRGRTGAGARALLLAVASVVLGVAAHGEAGGSVVPGPDTLAVAVLVAAATALVSSRPAGALRVTGLLGGGQLALHLVLAGSPTAHDMHAAPAGGLVGLVGAGPAMVAGHVAVTALVVAGVVGADRSAGAALVAAAHRGLADLAALRRRLRTPVPLDRPVTGPPDPAERVTATGVWLARIHPRRGPPAAACVPVPLPAR